MRKRNPEERQHKETYPCLSTLFSRGGSYKTTYTPSPPGWSGLETLNPKPVLGLGLRAQVENYLLKNPPRKNKQQDPWIAPIRKIDFVEDSARENMIELRLLLL